MAALSTQNHPSEPTTSSSAMNASYYNTMGMRLIRNPNPADVIAGRGGSVNSHPGNVQFREWVADRKTAYNLAMSKERKAVICKDVIQLVFNAGGRFLGRDKNTSFWLELDEERIMAKTSQALREGAPKIREAHREELGNGVPVRRRRKGRRPSHPPRELTPPPPSKRIRIRSPARSNNYKREEIITPPLQATPPPPSLALREEVTVDDKALISQLPPAMPLPRPLINTENKDSNNNIPRTHSLAFSDLSMNHDDIPEEFVNPFEDESELLGRINAIPPPPSQLLRNNSSPLSPLLGILRETSNNHNKSLSNGNHDALFHSQDSSKSNHSFGSLRYAPATTDFFHLHSNEEDGVMGLSLDWAAEDREWTQRAVSPYWEEEEEFENRNEEREASLIAL